MPPQAEIQKFIEEERTRESRRQELIQAILKERDEKISEYDEQLRLLNYNADPVSALSGGRIGGGGQSAGGTKATGKKRQMSPETREKMKAAQQARWAKIKGGKSK